MVRFLLALAEQWRKALLVPPEVSAAVGAELADLIALSLCRPVTS